MCDGRRWSRDLLFDADFEVLMFWNFSLKVYKTRFWNTVVTWIYVEVQNMDIPHFKHGCRIGLSQ
jgi:hypothetical protein